MTSKLLVEVAQSFSCRETDQKVWMLLPTGQQTHPASLEYGLVILRMKGNVGDDFANDRLDSCIVRIGVND